MGATTATIAVRGIHCGRCERAIVTALSRVDGVVSVHPDASRKQVRVRFDNQAVTEQAIRARLDELGHGPAP